MNKKKHKNNLTYYLIVVLECIVSGYYSDINIFFILTRLLIVLVVAAAIETDRQLVLKYMPIVFILLSLSGIRSKWQSIAEEKLTSKKSDLVLSIKQPVKPVLNDCSVLKRDYAIHSCQNANFILQQEYQKQKTLYDKQNGKVEKAIQLSEVNLTFYDQQPIWIYVLLSCGIVFISFIATVDTIKPVTEKINVDTLIKQELIQGKNSQKELAIKYNVSESKVSRLARRVQETAISTAINRKAV